MPYEFAQWRFNGYIIDKHYIDLSTMTIAFGFNARTPLQITIGSDLYIEKRAAILDDHPEAPSTPSCFVAGTKISTPDGVKNIESLKPGDKVLSYNSQSDQIVERYVTQTIVHQNRQIFEVTFTDGTRVEVTSEHPFYLVDQKKFIHVADLSAGMTVLKASGSGLASIPVQGIASLNKISDVYNLEVQGEHTYFANGILVHNAY